MGSGFFMAMRNRILPREKVAPPEWKTVGSDKMGDNDPFVKPMELRHGYRVYGVEL
jgi:hypothetical protein